MTIFYSWVNGFVIGLEHVTFKGGFSILISIAFLRLHCIIMKDK